MASSGLAVKPTAWLLLACGYGKTPFTIALWETTS
jgi:hypothetical protein